MVSIPSQLRSRDREKIEEDGFVYSQPLGIVILIGSKQGMQRVVARDNESGNVGQKLTTEVQDDEEEVERADADDGVCLGDTSLLFKPIQSWILGQLW